MGTEYYIVKPSTKEKFYLGRRIMGFDGIPSLCHREVDYAKWEEYLDVFKDLWDNNQYFFEGSYLIDEIKEFCYQIYEFCDDKVGHISDCCDLYSKYSDYTEIDVFSDILTKYEHWCELAMLVPKEYWIEEDNVLFEYETVKNYLQKLKEDSSSK